MKIIVGLGNPGSRYVATSHNLGFDVADELARRWGLSFRPSRSEKAEVAQGAHAGRPVMLAKPVTFMNLSGEAVERLVKQRDLGPDDLLIVSDDINLPIGRLRIRPGGGHGGHNGLRSIIDRLGGERLPRLRVGIQPSWEVEDLTRYVLQKPPPLEREQLREMVDLSADAVEMWVREGCEAAADRYNGMRRFDVEPEGS